MTAFKIPTWSRPLLTVAYSVSGWVITEIPVIMGIIPSTIDGYTTTSLAAGLSFVLSGAYFVHSHLSSYIVASAPIQNTSMNSPVSSTTSGTAAPEVKTPAVPSPVVPQFNQGGQMVDYTLASPLGTVEGAYTVGLTYNNAVSGSGDKVPSGAFYLGVGTFGYNGNYID